LGLEECDTHAARIALKRERIFGHF